jgi:hypothetical protein
VCNWENCVVLERLCCIEELQWSPRPLMHFASKLWTINSKSKGIRLFYVCMAVNGANCPLNAERLPISLTSTKLQTSFPPFISDIGELQFQPNITPVQLQGEPEASSEWRRPMSNGERKQQSIPSDRRSRSVNPRPRRGMFSGAAWTVRARGFTCASSAPARTSPLPLSLVSSPPLSASVDRL